MADGAQLDHVVLWVEDPLRSVAFYEEVLGFEGVRVEEVRTGNAPFPSVRVAEGTILDFMPLPAASLVDDMAGSTGSAGHPVNHVCFSFSKERFEEICSRLAERGVATSSVMEDSFGARGLAPRAIYFQDPDGNVLEARHYD